jgi:hypothetical protein
VENYDWRRMHCLNIFLISVLFFYTEVIIDSRKNSAIKNPSTGAYMQVDVWIPSLLLGFEFQVPLLPFPSSPLPPLILKKRILIIMLLHGITIGQWKIFKKETVSFIISGLKYSLVLKDNKRKTATQMAIRLISVSCWWDGALER